MMTRHTYSRLIFAALAGFITTCAFTLPAAHGQSGVQRSGSLAAALNHWQRHAPDILREYATFLSISCVSSNRDGVRTNARWIRDAFARRGVELSIHEIFGANPILIGRLDVGGALETVGIYAHYDGQPVNASAWDSDPWAATLRTASLESGGSEIPLPDTGTTIDDEWRLYARAAADDKAPIMAILAAFDALKTKDITPARNIVFLFEGEEEAGSPHLRDYLQKYAHDLAADAWLLCDGPVHQSRRPQLVFGVRGITSLELTVYGANRALHSGHYGNWAPNPAMELTQLLASMKDAQGRVTVEGFYDSVTPIGDAERRALDAMPTVDELLKQELGLNRTEGGGIRLEERLLLPSLNIRGLESATVGSTARNIVPASATADIDIRLVQGNDPAHMLDRVEHHIRTLGWHIVRDEPDDTTRRAHKKIARVVRH